MKKVQIDYELFRKLIFYHLGSDDQYEEDIRNGLEEKLDALVRHELYTKYKTAPSEEEQEKARQEYLDKERKSLEGKIELLEDLEKRLHKSMEQIVKREGYPNVQAFQKVYNKAEALIMEYNEELRAWKNQTEQKKENPLEQPKKASVLEKLHRYQQEGRQQPKRSVKRKSMDRER